MRFRLLLLTSFAALSAVACGSQEPPTYPDLFIDRTNLGFGQELNSGTYIGTITYNAILLQNNGDADLTISGYQLTGDDNAFTTQGFDNTTLKYQGTATMELAFKPVTTKVYNGTLVITSNAKNTPSVTVTLSGCGVDPNHSDLSYCKKSTDF